MKKGNVILIIVCIVIVVCGIVFMPTIYNAVNKMRLNNKKINVEIKKDNKKDSKEKITLKSEILDELVYPNMHNDLSVKDNYYKNKKIDVSSLTNNDILYNAFMQIYTGYMTNEGGTTVFSSDYLKSRIENTFGPKTKYVLTDFTVPSGSYSDFIGTFTYNSSNGNYYFRKESTTSKTVYYDVKSIYEVTTPDDNTINTFFYVGFIKISNNKYILYNDSNYTNEISSGNFTSFEDIAGMLKKLSVNKYQYTFRKDTCNYDSYCFYEGKWINE